MIPEYINNWFRVLESMHNENTYKLAWGRAIVECVHSNTYQETSDDKVSIGLNDIAICMLKYYWNQIFFFNLKQGPNREDKRKPLIETYTIELINKYKTTTKSSIPIWFDRAKDDIKKKDLLDAIKKIGNVLPRDVSWRFKNIATEVVDLYEYDTSIDANKIFISKDNCNLLKDYAVCLTRLLNYKWSQLLEKFNYSPRITNKVNSISDSKVKRESLKKYKDQLLKAFGKDTPVDFYTGEALKIDDISVDHVIPWSFMFSDDIWNLVLTSKSYNSSKSNSIPDQKVIDKLKERNKNIVAKLDGRFREDMIEANTKDYLDKFYFQCRL